ncbi:putative cue domain-containing protein [Rosellinia necatrix]|uniref:Putative cue domain-containing protein n=1 Tax=Rosellinia necatrix TaxID=77044 RepID=A0A1S7UJL8_ROSNE|nr:putative cue domain-containing protein [Rosellinia necatrix]
MEEEQVSFTSLILVVVLGGLAIRYLFFSSSSGAPGSSAANQGRDAAATSRAREAAVDRMQQMFPQLDRRTVLWELQRSGGNIATATERVLTGRLETPPITFQPPPPPPSSTTTTPSAPQGPRAPEPAPEPDLITRYKLQNRVNNDGSSSETTSEPTAPGMKTKAWSSNREERQTALQRRRDDMILAARRKMEAKIAAEKAAASGNTGSGA